MFDVDLMRRLSSVAALSELELEQLRANREYDSDAALESLERSNQESIALADDDVSALISTEARDLVIGFEVSDRQTYERKYVSPEWPKGASGITIGIGYDVGYHTKAELAQHWAGLISDGDIARLSRAVGVKGNSAAAILSDFRDIRVPWDAAITAYERSTMPKYGRLVLQAFPGSIERPGHCFGALFSLVFNRGASLDGDRRKEMRNIRDHCAARAFENVPGEIRDMKRIWQGQGLTGLLKRRDAEALLYARGLEQLQVAVAQPEAQQSESLNDPNLVDGDGLYADEDEKSGEGLERSGLYTDVKWPANDDDAPDYQHITDRSLVGKTFEFNARAVELLIQANAFEPTREHGRIIFALRGAELVTSLAAPQPVVRQVDRMSLTLRDCRPNHKDLRCVIGVYDLTTNRLSGFASSTVPNRGAVSGYYSNRQAGNMMPTGCYRFEVGWHLMSAPTRKIPGCLIENGRQKCVHRSINNLMYDLEDTWESHRLHGDNLHPAKSASTASFSSLGCLVVSGDYQCTSADRSRGTHTGEWAQFRKALGLTQPATGDHGRQYDVVLVTGLEAAIASKLTETATGADAAASEKLSRLRFGSKGERVRRLEAGLQLSPSGVMGAKVLKAWTEQQTKDFDGRSIGVYSPASEEHYKFGVFNPVALVVASNRISESASAGVLDAPRSEQLEQLYYEIGLQAEAARRNPSSNTSTLESLGSSTLESINLEFGFANLKSYGLQLVQLAEGKLRQTICGDPAALVGGRATVRDQVNVAAQGGLTELRRYLSSFLTTLLPIVPPSLSDKIIDALFERILRPAAGGAGDYVVAKMGLSAEWLCQQWCEKAAEPTNDPAIAPDAPAVSAPRAVEAPPPSAAPSKSQAPNILSLIEQAAKGSSPDTAGVRRYIRDLRGLVDKGELTLSDGDTKRLLATLCDTTFMEQVPGAIGGDPYALMRDVEISLKATPPNKVAAKNHLIELHALLTDARMKLQPQEVKRLLVALRGAKMFDELSWMADRFAARDPELLGVVTTSYAQGLIDSGRLIAGIEILQAAQELGILSPEDAKDATGILGRAHKQIYVNHVKSTSDAAALRDSFGKHLAKAIASYGTHYDPSRPGENSYQGVNYLALIKRAERDRIAIDVKTNSDGLAQGLIDAIESKTAPDCEDAWLLATVAEAYLALGKLEKAAEFYGLYANHASITPFQLNSTVRQLEEVWQLKAGPDGESAILANLKGVLAQKENGFVSLASDERRAIAKAGNVEFQQYFETTTQGGKYINFGLLKRIVACGASVAAIQIKLGKTGRTVGTGFLVKGPDFSPSLLPDKSYVLTNAHVVWDHTRSQVQEDKAISPEMARVVFENDHIDGRPDVYSCRVVWQSPSSALDATLLELDRAVEHIMPLEVAATTGSLSVASKTQKGSKLAVLGHPNGGSLSIGVLGSLDEMQGTLVDRGPRDNTTNPIFLHYMTPTEPGNSGSPVFESEGWRVVALHHVGFVEGTRGLRKLGGKGGEHLANEGICIESIRSATKYDLSPSPAKQPRKKWWG